MLLQSIAEVAEEPLMLSPTDPMAEAEANTWWLGAERQERAALSVGQVVAAFERAAEMLWARVRGMGSQGAVTFYVWHDEQAGQLRCSTSSQAPNSLPFESAYAQTNSLGSVIERFLHDQQPGVMSWNGLGDASGLPVPEEPTLSRLLPVWTCSIGEKGCH